MAIAWLTVAVSITGVIAIPALVLIIRVTIRWTRVEDNQNKILSDIEKVIEDKDRAHAELWQTIREDRRATDRRLRWLEEHLWKRDGPTGSLCFCYEDVMVS